MWFFAFWSQLWIYPSTRALLFDRPTQKNAKKKQWASFALGIGSFPRRFSNGCWLVSSSNSKTQGSSSILMHSINVVQFLEKLHLYLKLKTTTKIKVTDTKDKWSSLTLTTYHFFFNIFLLTDVEGQNVACFQQIFWFF